MHPLRQRLHNELHARPSLYFDEPAHVFHLAFLGSNQECYAFLQNCCPGTQDLNAAQGITQLDGHALKWELHAEFFTLTLVVTSSGDDLAWTTLPEALASMIEVYLSTLINSVQIVVRGEVHLDLSRYGFKDPSGSCVGGGAAMVWSDFRLSEDSSSHILFVNRRLNAYRQGRMIRRLLEIETYRMMASLSFPSLTPTPTAVMRDTCLRISPTFLPKWSAAPRKPATVLAQRRPTLNWCSNAWGNCEKVTWEIANALGCLSSAASNPLSDNPVSFARFVWPSLTGVQYQWPHGDKFYRSG